MLPEVGGLEYLLIAAVALIVVGPKDLPVMLRKLGEWVGRLRSMAAEFRASFDDMARQSELDELRREVEAMRQSHGALLTSETAEVNQVLREIDDSLRGADLQFHPPFGGAPAEQGDAEETQASLTHPEPQPGPAARRSRRSRTTSEEAE